MEKIILKNFGKKILEKTFLESWKNILESKFGKKNLESKFGKKF